MKTTTTIFALGFFAFTSLVRAAGPGDLIRLYEEEVLAQLEAASNNHLRAFHRNLTVRDGDTYQPEALTPAELEAILKDSQGACGCRGACGDKPRQGAASGKRGGGQSRGKGPCAATPPANMLE